MSDKPKLTFHSYSDDCKRFGVDNPYPDETSFNRAYGIDQTAEPLIITPKNRNRPMSATLENHISHADEKVSQPKKKYAPRISRKGWTTEQIKARRSENVQKCKARKKLAQVIL